MAVVLLAAPLITMIQYFNKDAIDNPPAGLENNFNLTTHPLITLSMNERLIDPETPDGDWDSYIGTLCTGVCYTIGFCLLWSSIVLSMSGPTTPLHGIMNLYYAPAFKFTGMYGVVLFSLLIRAALLKGNPRLHSLLQFVNPFLFLFITSFALFASESSGYAFSRFHFVDSFYNRVDLIELDIVVALAYKLFYRL